MLFVPFFFRVENGTKNFTRLQFNIIKWCSDLILQLMTNFISVLIILVNPNQNHV